MNIVDTLKDIANAIRERTQTTAPMNLDAMILQASTIGGTDDIPYISGTLVNGKTKALKIWEYCCYQMGTLESMDLEAATEIGTSSFRECNLLSTLILRSDAVVTLKSANAFYNTPIHDGTGSIYVPDALVDAYKTATNWTTFADEIKPISQLGG